MKKNKGRVRLFTDGDINKPFVGWHPIKQYPASLINEDCGAVLRVVIQDENGNDLYDRTLIMEAVGVIVVCSEDDRVAMVENFRFISKPIREVTSGYLKQLNKQNLWDEAVASCGRWQWELPHGAIQTGEAKNTEDYIMECAKQEVLEELGFELGDLKLRGELNSETAYVANSGYVVSGKIIAKSRQKPKKNEMLGEVKLFSATEIRQMVNRRELINGLTLSALAISGFHF